MAVSAGLSGYRSMTTCISSPPKGNIFRGNVSSEFRQIHLATPGFGIERNDAVIGVGPIEAKIDAVSVAGGLADKGNFSRRSRSDAIDRRIEEFRRRLDARPALEANDAVPVDASPAPREFASRASSRGCDGNALDGRTHAGGRF
jgi:hypothetical protein